MNFTVDLDSAERARIAACDVALHNPQRLAALARTRLMGTANELEFDRLAAIAARVLDVPLTIISLVSDKTQFFKAAYGLPSPYDVRREIPIDDSICRYTLQNQPIIAADTQQHELLRSHPTVDPWGIKAFISIPMQTFDGQVLGSFCAIDTKIHPWSADDILLMEELTASVMREIHLRQQIEDLKLERELRKKFVAALSHDLRNPLNVVKMAAELIKDDDTAAADRELFLNMISENCVRADQMIQELLNEHSKQLGEPVIAQEKEDLVRTIRHSALSWKSVYGDRLNFDFSNDVKAQVNANHIRRVVENLIGNASKYGTPNGPISISVKQKMNEAIVSVHNVGNPIPPENLDNIFSFFKRTESALTSQKIGWGIGLAVVHSLTDEMNGFVHVESTPEVGTIFSVHIPII